MEPYHLLAIGLGNVHKQIDCLSSTIDTEIKKTYVNLLGCCGVKKDKSVIYDDNDYYFIQNSLSVSYIDKLYCDIDTEIHTTGLHEASKNNPISVLTENNILDSNCLHIWELASNDELQNPWILNENKFIYNNYDTSGNITSSFGITFGEIVHHKL